MNKLKLNLDELRVETFAAEAPARRARGTVHGHATEDGAFTCAAMFTCEPMSGCQNTVNRCPASYYPTCFPRCQTGMDC